MYAHIAEFSSVPPSVLRSHLNLTTKLLLQTYYLVPSARNSKHISVYYGQHCLAVIFTWSEAAQGFF